jgi:hypothetical protein
LVSRNYYVFSKPNDFVFQKNKVKPNLNSFLLPVFPTLESWSSQVKKNNQGRCLITGKKERNLESHHLFSKKKHPKLKFVLLNGISIKADYHKLFHKLYGYHTTLDDFVRFIVYLELNYPQELDLFHCQKLKNYLLSIQPFLQKLLV